MSATHFPGRRGGWRAWLAAAVLAASGAAAARAGEGDAPPPLPPAAVAAPAPVPLDGGVVQAGCATCGGGLVGGTVGGGGCATCGGGNGCIPGRDPEFCCCGWAADTAC